MMNRSDTPPGHAAPRRRTGLAAAALALVSALALALAGCQRAGADAAAPGAASTAAASGPVEITLMRFFGSCDARYGTSTDATKAVGECGILTSLVNRFNAEHQGRIVVKTQTAEWGPYYDQLTARLVAQDVPAISVMHESLIGDYVRRKLIEPLDDGFREVGIDVDDFTDHARRGVTYDGRTWAMPFDTWSWLWHFNMGLMKKAGLVQADGSPVLPRSPAELLAQARQFKAATGKPYFTWAAANEQSANTRTLLTLVFQQGGRIFSDDGRHLDLHTPEVKRALDLMKQLYDEGHIKPGTDYPGANQAFLNGDAGVLIVGTWTIDQYMKEARSGDSALRAGYHVTPFPQLFEKPAAFADGHAWVLMKGGTPDPRSRRAALEVLKFFYDHDLDWARTGHLPTRRSIAESAEFRALPYRAGLATITRDGVSVPSVVPTQRAVEALIGEDVSNLLVNDKPREQVLSTIEKRVNAALRRAHR